MDRQLQIEAAARGEGHYPVERAFDNPGDDSEIIHRYGVDTEEGIVYVKVRWVEIGGKKRPQAYSVEVRDGDRVPAEHFRQRLVGSVRVHLGDI